jgi:hypothetical protein
MTSEHKARHHVKKRAHGGTSHSTPSRQLTRSNGDAPTLVVVKPLINEPLLQIEDLRLESHHQRAPSLRLS